MDTITVAPKLKKLRQSYNLVLAKYSKMSVLQQKLGFYAFASVSFSDVDLKEIENTDGYQKYSLDIHELESVANLKTKNWKYEVKKALKKLTSAVIELPDIQNGRIVSQEGYQFYTWFSGCRVSGDTIEFDIHNKLLPHLYMLKSYFVELDLPSTWKLKNKHSLFLYPHLKKIMKISPYRFTYPELIEITRLEGTSYSKDWHNFKRFVLDKMKADFKKNADITFTYKSFKGGNNNAVKYIEFTVREQKKDNQLTIKGLDNTFDDREIIFNKMLCDLQCLSFKEYYYFKDEILINADDVQTRIDKLEDFIKKIRIKH